MLVLNFNARPGVSKQIARPARPASRKLGLLKRILRSMHLSRRAQAARIIEEHRQLGLFKTIED